MKPDMSPHAVTMRLKKTSELRRLCLALGGDRIKKRLLDPRVRTMEKPVELADLIDRFLDYSLPRSFSAKSLAIELAKRTRFLRDVLPGNSKRRKPRWKPVRTSSVDESYHE